MNLYIIKSNLTGNKGDLFLTNHSGHCHLLPSVETLLQNDKFREKNPNLVPIFEKAALMMKNGETGIVNP